ncbi:hypothetical protein MCBRY_000687 [Methylocystis bryophila]|uniref:Tox-REase-5 domain-containing protein n=2 Tax=Methylocystis bryophila TaxID=655015 RepID=A0A1W6MT20_9HYPH|nr:hypothetical protein B1812_06040 [Methylocystis bryophila]
MKGLGFGPPRRDFVKYDPNQPRIPAGNGRSSGRWGTGGGTPTEPVSARGLPPAATQASRDAQALRATRGVGTFAEGLFDTVASSEFLTGLGTLAESAAGPAVTLGAIFIPTPAGRVSEGVIPGQPDLHYSFDEPAGVLRLYGEDESGRQTVAYASRGAHGIFADSDTGVPIARLLNGSLVFDADSLADDWPDQASQSTPDEPRLCPDPGPDVPHGASERAKAYQLQISALNNPQRPLPPGMAVSLINPRTGKRVTFDDCRESDGTMIEAKGPSFSRMLKYEFLAERIKNRWLSQADRQLAAAGSRDVEWFFAEPEAREKAREWFKAKYQKIELSLVPAEAP